MIPVCCSDYTSDNNHNADLAVAINANNKYNPATVNTDINFRFTNKF